MERVELTLHGNSGSVKFLLCPAFQFNENSLK